ncbi:MAG TPA: hypothetical protein VD928_01785 [Candidatus Paceibacterota bacterium]|nr:hypothetical protein [Candidatus Paceibacterota bacterium]
MDNVNFLNLEYLIVRAYEIFFSVPAVDVVVEEAQSPATETVRSIATFSGAIAVLGILLTILLIVLITWIRVRAVIVEDEGFDAKEREKREDIEAPVIVEAKNPQWDRVHTLANSPEENDWRRAILEADIMLGNLLREQGYRGESVGEMLRDANPLQFTTLDLAWKAHKVRNEIAHAGEGYTLTQRDANATIDLYRSVFEEFNYI